MKERKAMDRRTRTSFAAGLALALAGCSTATPSQPVTTSATAPSSAIPTAALPTAATTPTQTAGLAGTIAYGRNHVDGDFQGPYRLFTMPASGSAGTQLLDVEAEQARWSADGTRLSVVVETITGRIF